jgi:hypothetical protein
MINHQVKVIQWFFKKKFNRILRAKAVIIKRWKIFKQRLDRRQLIESKVFLIRHKRAAKVIERQYIIYRFKKLRKWTKHVDYSKISNFMAKVITIQRSLRRFLMRKFRPY